MTNPHHRSACSGSSSSEESENDNGGGDNEVEDEIWLDEYELSYKKQREKFRRRIERKGGDYLLRCHRCLIFRDHCSYVPGLQLRGWNRWLAAEVQGLRLVI